MADTEKLVKIILELVNNTSAPVKDIEKELKKLLDSLNNIDKQKDALNKLTQRFNAYIKNISDSSRKSATEQERMAIAEYRTKERLLTSILNARKQREKEQTQVSDKEAKERERIAIAEARTKERLLASISSMRQKREKEQTALAAKEEKDRLAQQASRAKEQEAIEEGYRKERYRKELAAAQAQARESEKIYQDTVKANRLATQQKEKDAVAAERNKVAAARAAEKEQERIVIAEAETKRKLLERVTQMRQRYDKKIIASANATAQATSKIVTSSTVNRLKSVESHANALSSTLSSGSGNVLRFRNAVKALGKGIGEVDNGFKSFKLTLTGLESFFLSQGLAIAVLSKGITALRNSFKEAEKAQGAMIGLASITRFAGEDISKSIKEATDIASDGLISIQDAATSLKNLLSRGFSLEQSVQILKRFKDAAAFGRQSSLSLSEAVRSATEGIKNENSILVDNAGVTKNVSKMWEEYAKSIGKGVRSLTLADKRTAEFNGIMAETEGMVGNAQQVLETLTGTTAKYEQSVRKVSTAFGTSLIPTFTVLANTLSWILNEWLTPFLGGWEMFWVKIFHYLTKASKYFSVAPFKWWSKEFQQDLKNLDSALESTLKDIDNKYKGQLDVSKILGKDSGARRKDAEEAVKTTTKGIETAFKANVAKIEADINKLKGLYKRNEVDTSYYFERRRELAKNAYDEEIKGLNALLKAEGDASKGTKISALKEESKVKVKNLTDAYKIEVYQLKELLKGQKYQAVINTINNKITEASKKYENDKTNILKEENAAVKKLNDNNTLNKKQEAIRQKIIKAGLAYEKEKVSILNEEHTLEKKLRDVHISTNKVIEETNRRTLEYSYTIKELMDKQRELEKTIPKVYPVIREQLSKSAREVKNIFAPVSAFVAHIGTTLKPIGDKIADITKKVVQIPGTSTVDFELQKQFDAEMYNLETKHTEDMITMAKQLTDAKALESIKQVELLRLQYAQEQELIKLRNDQENRAIQARMQMHLAAAGILSNTFSDLNTAFGKNTKAFFYLQKAAALAEAIINTEVGVTAALKQGGAIFGISMASLVRAQGMAAIAAIAAQTIEGMAQGGEVKGYSPHAKADNIPIRATAGEFIQPVDTVKFYGKDFMEAIRLKMIPRDIFKNFKMPVLTPQPKLNFATGGTVSPVSNRFSVNVPVTVSGIPEANMSRVSGILKEGIEDTVIKIMRKEFR
jgi:septal ring factor EnvC (AmiA/AmiB activator)